MTKVSVHLLSVWEPTTVNLFSYKIINKSYRNHCNLDYLRIINIMPDNDILQNSQRQKWHKM